MLAYQTETIIHHGDTESTEPSSLCFLFL